MYKPTPVDIQRFQGLFSVLKEKFRDGPMPATITLDQPAQTSVPAPGATGAQQQANAANTANIQQSIPDNDGLCTLTGVTNDELKGKRFALDYVKNSFDQGDRRYWIIEYACSFMESEMTGSLSHMGVPPTGVVNDVERQKNGTYLATNNNLPNAFAIPSHIQNKEDAVAWINEHGPRVNPNANGEGFHP